MGGGAKELAVQGEPWLQPHLKIQSTLERRGGVGVGRWGSEGRGRSQLISPKGVGLRETDGMGSLRGIWVHLFLSHPALKPALMRN